MDNNDLEQSSEFSFETAATMFGLYAPRFQEQIKELSTGQLRRLLNALIQYPLNDKIFIEDNSANLKSAYHMGQALLEAKFLMIFNTVLNAEQKKQSDNEGEKPNEQNQT